MRSLPELGRTRKRFGSAQPPLASRDIAGHEYTGRPPVAEDAEASRAQLTSLAHLLKPASIAVVGASRHPGTVGRAVLHNIVSGGFAGHVYAVNPRARHVEGVTCVPSVASLPEAVDLAVVVVPAAAVRDVADECGRCGVRALVVITAGLDPGAGADLLAICRRHGIRLVGPHCFGIAIPHIGLNATFAAAHPAAGRAGLVVQSGTVGVALLDHLSRLGIGVSSFASLGDKFDVSSNDLLMWWEQDGVTELAMLNVDSFGSPRKFARAARRLGRRMPVLTMSAGREHAATEGPQAAAPPPVCRDRLREQAGIIATASPGELLEAAALLASQPLPPGDRVAVVSNVGGGGMDAACACGDSGLRVAALAGQTQRRLRHLLPHGAAVKGPVDTTAAVTHDGFRACLEEVAADDNVDMVLAVVVPTATGEIMPAIVTAELVKPLAATLLTQPEAVRLLSRGGSQRDGASAARGTVPCYASAASAARALAHAARYHAWRSEQHGRVPLLDGVREADARALIGHFLARHRHGGWLPAGEAGDLLSCYGIPLAAMRPVTSEEAAVSVAEELGGHVLLTADVPGLLPGGNADTVRAGLRTEHDVRRGYQALTELFGRALRHVLVQRAISDGVEVHIGVVQEPVFGPAVVAGPAGRGAGASDDRAVRLVPLTDTDARDMICGLGSAAPSPGQDGTSPAGLPALADTLLRVSQLADDMAEVAEIELDPVVARPDGVTAVSARVRITPAEPQDPFLRRLR